MKVGDSMKVVLPGESPWAEVVEVFPDGRWLGRIDNHLVCGDMHDYCKDDLVLFEPPYMANRGILVSVPAPLH